MRKEKTYDSATHGQRHFRVLMDAVARPGTIGKLEAPPMEPPPGLNRAAACAAMALMDGNVRFHAPEQAVLEKEYLSLNTSSHPSAPEEADFLFLDGSSEPDIMEKTRQGQPRYPETGATVVIGVSRLSASPEAGDLVMRMSGPGIPGTRELYAKGLRRDLMEALAGRNREFPMGVDAILATGEGEVACIPRTTKVQFQAVSA